MYIIITLLILVNCKSPLANFTPLRRFLYKDHRCSSSCTSYIVTNIVYEGGSVRNEILQHNLVDISLLDHTLLTN